MIVVKKINVTGKLSSYFLRPAGRATDPDNPGRLHAFLAVEIIVTDGGLATMPVSKLIEVTRN